MPEKGGKHRSEDDEEKAIDELKRIVAYTHLTRLIL